MKTALFTILIFAMGISCFGQEIEFSGSLNTSSEQRLQNAGGIGIQYQNDLGVNWKIGVGMHYNFKKTDFDYIPYIDEPDLLVTEDISSQANRFSVRLNLQRLLKNTDNVSISLGPEFSYNFLWGKDNIDERIGDRANRYDFSRNTGLMKSVGIGLISKVQIKNFISPHLSLCLAFRPEVLLSRNMFVKGGEQPVFSGPNGFSEFQIGLLYSFHTNK